MSVAEPGLLPAPHATLEETWTRPPGVRGWLAAADHKRVGMRFMVTAMVFFLLGGIESLILRAQLARANLDVVSPELYNQIFTMHGTTMMFLFAVPFLEGLALYLVPLMIGSRETPFPRMNAFAYWTYLFAGLALYGSLFAGVAPDAGWFSYPTLTLKEHSPTTSIDFWAMSVTLLELSALTVAVTLVAMILKHRAPGMAISRMPIFVWAILIFATMIIFAMPSLLLATVLLELDRMAGTHFFNPAEGGDPVFFQHLFWWFGHPEVYIIFIPAVGIVASILPAFTRREVVGYSLVVFSLIATGFISFSVWAHHMFATGISRLGLAFFSAATLAVAIPSGVQVFAWVATVWSSHRPVWRTPLLFTAGFVVNFVIGGITGVTLAVVPFDWQVHDTFYVVGHFHYVLIGGMVFPILAGFFYWFPKFTGRMLSERLGRWSFWLLLAGTNLTFFPMHLSGFWGMPRRVYTYHAGLGLTAPNLVSTVGAFTMAAAVALFLVNVARALRSGPAAGPNPWGADTLEWAVASPPPAYNFAAIPTVRSRAPLWVQPELAHPPAVARGWGDGEHGEERLAVELREDRRETVLTTALDAVPDGRNIVAGPSLWPLATAASAAFALVGAIASAWALPIGMTLAFVCLAAWHWPERRGDPVPIVGGHVDAAEAERIGRPARTLETDALPTCHEGPQAPLWWAMVLFITIEIVFFAAIVTGEYYLRGMEPLWPPGKTEPPKLHLPIAYTIVLLASSVPMYMGDRAIRKGKQGRLVVCQVAAISLALVFLALKGIEYSVFVSYTWYSHAYGSLAWTISGFHALHVLSVVLKAAVVLALALRGHFTAERHLGVEINGLYWHFVVLIWLPLFFTLYVYPYTQPS